jgi:hypothetical protein
VVQCWSFSAVSPNALVQVRDMFIAVKASVRQLCKMNRVYCDDFLGVWDANSLVARSQRSKRSPRCLHL